MQSTCLGQDAEAHPHNGQAKKRALPQKAKAHGMPQSKDNERKKKEKQSKKSGGAKIWWWTEKAEDKTNVKSLVPPQDGGVWGAESAKNV